MEQATAYNFSKGIQQAKKRYKVLSVMLPVALIVFLFLSPISKDLSPTVIASIGFVSFISIGLIFYFTASKTLRKLSELSVYIFSDKLERIAPENKEEFFWKELLRVEILEHANGEILSIKLAFANKKIVTLFGFENMGVAIDQIAQYVPDKDLIHRKRAKINWDNPIIMILSSILTVAIILGIQEIGEKAYLFFNILFSFLFGSYNLIARPISRAQGKSWKRFETIIGIVLIIGSLFLLVIELLLIGY